MSRFADIAALSRYSFGACQCPGTPHDEDFAMYRTQLGASALARIGRAHIEGAVQHDPLAAHRQLVIEAVAEWNLLWLDPSSDGEDRPVVPVPINAATVELLDDSIVAFANAIDAANGGPAPNGSGAPSRASSRGSASRARTKTKTPGT